MEIYQRQFIEFALQRGALKFGNFKLKSGRQSPYFFNMGVFHDGESLSKIGGFYAAALQKMAVPFDVLFGPAYKGIPLVCATATALLQQYQQNAAFCFNRKEVKEGGEGGILVGAPLQGQRVLLMDDVLTAGTAAREAIDLIQQANAQLAAILVAFDRQEIDKNSLPALQEIQRQYQVPVFSIIQLEQVIEFLSTQPEMQQSFESLRDYRAIYGVSVPQTVK